MTTTDETYAAELRSAAQGVVPPMSVEHGVTAHLGRRRRRRVAVVRTGAAAVVAAGVCVGVALLPAVSPRVTPPAGSASPPAASAAPDTSATAVGSVEVMAGLHASTGAAPVDQGWDLGLALPRDGGRVTLRPLPESDLPVGEHGVQVTAATGARLDVRVVWATGHGPEWSDGLRRGTPPSVAIARTSTVADGTSAQLVVGAVPPWMAGGRVLAWFPTFTADGFGTGHGVELPTFTDPTGSEATLFAAVFDQTRSDADVPGTHSSVYLVAPDGTVYGPNGCTGAGCVPADQPDLQGLATSLGEVGARLR
jgi:hypothetical protein